MAGWQKVLAVSPQELSGSLRFRDRSGEKLGERMIDARGAVLLTSGVVIMICEKARNVVFALRYSRSIKLSRIGEANTHIRPCPQNLSVDEERSTGFLTMHSFS